MPNGILSLGSCLAYAKIGVFQLREGRQEINIRAMRLDMARNDAELKGDRLGRSLRFIAA